MKLESKFWFASDNVLQGKMKNLRSFLNSTRSVQHMNNKIRWGFWQRRNKSKIQEVNNFWTEEKEINISVDKHKQNFQFFLYVPRCSWKENRFPRQNVSCFLISSIRCMKIVFENESLKHWPDLPSPSHHILFPLGFSSQTFLSNWENLFVAIQRRSQNA